MGHREYCHFCLEPYGSVLSLRELQYSSLQCVLYTLAWSGITYLITMVTLGGVASVTTPSYSNTPKESSHYFCKVIELIRVGQCREPML